MTLSDLGPFWISPLPVKCLAEAGANLMLGRAGVSGTFPKGYEIQRAIPNAAAAAQPPIRLVCIAPRRIGAPVK